MKLISHKYLPFYHTLFMKKALPIIAGVTLILFALTLSSTATILGAIGEAVRPFFYGIFFALLFKSPVNFLEKTLFRWKGFAKIRRPLSIAFALVVSIALIGLAVYLIIPELKHSLKAIQKGVEWLSTSGLDKVVDRNDTLAEWLKNALNGIMRKIEETIPNLFEKLSTTLKGVLQLFLGLMLGLTMLANGKKEVSLLERWCNLTFGEKKSEFLKGAVSAFSEKFSRYLAGSLVESLIFSVVCYLAFLIFKIPYPLLIAVIVGIFNLIPSLGGYLGGGMGALIILAISPSKVLPFLLITFILQQVEQATTYPIIVGKYIGLNAFMVLLAVVVGGGLFGFWGLILGVPVFAFLYNLISVVLSIRAKRDD